MDGFWALLAVVGGFAAVLAGCVWLGRRVRRRGTGGGLMGPLDEIYHPEAHRLRMAIEVHEQRVVPLPAAGDQPRREAD